MSDASHSWLDDSEQDAFAYQAKTVQGLHRCVSGSVTTLFSHSTVDELASFAQTSYPQFPTYTYLLLLRNVVPHRVSRWLEKVYTYDTAESVGTTRTARDFARWIRSASYRNNFKGYQISRYTSLMGGSSPSSGAEAAQLLRDNEAVAWIGVSDDW